MNLARDCCFTSVVFESDCSVLIQSVNGDEEPTRNYFANIVKGIKDMKRCF